MFIIVNIVKQIIKNNYKKTITKISRKFGDTNGKSRYRTGNPTRDKSTIW